MNLDCSQLSRSNFIGIIFHYVNKSLNFTSSLFQHPLSGLIQSRKQKHLTACFSVHIDILLCSEICWELWHCLKRIVCHPLNQFNIAILVQSLNLAPHFRCRINSFKQLVYLKTILQISRCRYRSFMANVVSRPTVGPHRTSNCNNACEQNLPLNTKCTVTEQFPSILMCSIKARCRPNKKQTNKPDSDHQRQNRIFHVAPQIYFQLNQGIKKWEGATR